MKEVFELWAYYADSWNFALHIIFIMIIAVETAIIVELKRRKK